MLVCAYPKTNCPCWWQAPDEWVPRGHTAIYFASIMSQCGRSQSFLLLYTRPMYAHKQHYSPPHWRIRPLLGQKKSGGRNHSLHKHSRSHLQYTTVCPTPRPGAQGRRMLTFAEVVILLSQRGILTDKDKTLTSNLPKKVWHS